MEEFMIMLEALVLMTLLPCLRTSDNVQWPRGTYGIPKPADGCPSVEAFRWQQGWRCQDSNGHKNSKNAKSPAFHVDAVVDGEKVNRSFCIKTHTASDGNRLGWPPGQYCIYKYQRCPDGLTEGFVLWDDDDSLSVNENGKGGTLPNGSYDHNTKIEFCCRTDGDKSHPILLPTRAPFYLLAYGSEQCQMVEWAIATQEWIYYDTEDSRNLDQANGTYPYRGGEKHPTIYYCYYQACSVNLTGAIGTFNSRMDADIHYCSWRITVSPVLQIIIKFTNFSLQNAGNDSLLVYDGEDASKKVLGVFYNGQLPPKEGISSTSNHMFVVFKSNNHTKDSGFFASYYTFNKSLHPTSASSGSSVTAKATSQSLTQSSHSHTERKANEGGQSKKAMVYGPVIGVLLVALIVLVVYTVWIRKRGRKYTLPETSEFRPVSYVNKLITINPLETFPEAGLDIIDSSLEQLEEAKAAETSLGTKLRESELPITHEKLKNKFPIEKQSSTLDSLNSSLKRLSISLEGEMSFTVSVKVSQEKG